VLERGLFFRLELGDRAVEASVLGTDLLLKQLGALAQIGENVMHEQRLPRT
jgi:hypothetical protein